MSAAIYGGVEGGMTSEADEFIRSVMEDMLDKHQGLPQAVTRCPRTSRSCGASTSSGRARSPMSDLRALFDALGHADVRTYIQSGNVVFDAKAARPAAVRAAIEQGHRTRVRLRRHRAAAHARRARGRAEAQPVRRRGVRDVPRRVSPTASSSPRSTRSRTRPTSFAVDGREVFVRCPNGYGRTKINNTFFERKLATRATTRNWKTVSTLHEWATG